VLRADNLITVMCRNLEIWEPQSPGTVTAPSRPVIGLLYLIFRLVAQCLNQMHRHVPAKYRVGQTVLADVERLEC